MTIANTEAVNAEYQKGRAYSYSHNAPKHNYLKEGLMQYGMWQEQPDSVKNLINGVTPIR